MDLNTLTNAKGARKARKRVGRGIGSTRGGTSTRGHKGQKSRSGGSIPTWFEGGQMPLQRRVPKRGFTNIFRRKIQVVNLADIAARVKDKKISPETLFENGLISSKTLDVKILGDGEVKKALEITAHAFSKSAIEKIEKAGGKAIKL